VITVQEQVIFNYCLVVLKHAPAVKALERNRKSIN
jgi:hypothetical protein